MATEYFLSDNGEFYVTPEIQTDFDRNGFALVRKLFSEAEVAKIKNCVEESTDLKDNSYSKADQNGKLNGLCIWNKAGNDVLGTAAR